jgi:DNA-binding transcriptional LysR family regulator
MESIPLSGLDLNLLVALESLLRRRSVTVAASDLGLSQPATSRALQRLRDALGDPLLVRVGREMVPTDRALALEQPVADALRAARRVFEPPAAFDPATATGEVTIAMGDEAQVALADAVVAALRAAAPGIDVRIRPLSATSVDEGRRGLFDLAIAPDLSALPAVAGAPDLSEFVVQSLYTRRFVVASSRQRPRLGLNLDDYASASHVIVSFEGGGRGFVDDILAGLGRRRRVAVSVTNFLAAASLIAATDLLGTLPEEVVFLHHDTLVACRPPLDLPVIPILAVWHPRRTADPRHRFLREVVKDAIRQRAAAWPSSVAVGAR